MKLCSIKNLKHFYHKELLNYVLTENQNNDISSENPKAKLWRSVLKMYENYFKTNKVNMVKENGIWVVNSLNGNAVKKNEQKIYNKLHALLLWNFFEVSQSLP